jgi:hypothetical protein
MKAYGSLSAIMASIVLASCGLYVPEIQENPFATEAERANFIQSIVRNVRCEVQDAVVRLYAENSEIDPLNRNLAWFDSWAAQVSLTLTIDEKGSASPVISLLPPSPPTNIFTLGIGITQSEEAQRVDKIGSFFTVQDLKRLAACPAEDRHRGLFILESDLKLYEWLQATMITIGLGDTPAPADQSGPYKSNVLSHEVKFDIVSTGSVTPAWKLIRATVNQSGTFLSGTRDRTQDMTITFGPLDPTWKEYVYVQGTNRILTDPRTHLPVVRPAVLAPAAQSAVLASDIANAISNAVRNGLRQ